VEKERVVALIGTVNDDVAMVQAPLVNQWQIPWIIPIAATHQLPPNSNHGLNYIFRVVVPDNEQADFMVSFALNKNFARLALVTDNSKVSQEGRKLLTASLKKAYVTPIFDDTIYPDDKPENQIKFVTNLKQSYPDLLLLWGPTQTAGQLLALLNEQKMNLPFLSNENLAVLGFGKQLAETTDNIYMPQTFVVDNPNDRQQDFINHYRRYFNTDLLDFPSGLAQSYDAMRMLGEALIQPGAADNRELLRNSLESLGSYEGLIKVYKQPWKAGASREALSGQDLVMTFWKNNKLIKTS
jgi:ABC-type branched-subunit amino acid transport system substrate-binding protein